MQRIVGTVSTSQRIAASRAVGRGGGTAPGCPGAVPRGTGPRHPVSPARNRFPREAIWMGSRNRRTAPTSVVPRASAPPRPGMVGSGETLIGFLLACSTFPRASPPRSPFPRKGEGPGRALPLEGISPRARPKAKRGSSGCGPSDREGTAMDDRRFDQLARAAATPGSRRGLLRLLAGGAVAALLGRAPVAAAQKIADPDAEIRCRRNRDCRGGFRCRQRRRVCRRRRETCGFVCCRPGLACCNRLLGICREPGEPCPR